MEDRPLEDVVALLSQSDVAVSCDMGFVHIAAALGKRTVTIAGPTQIASTRPYSRFASVVRTKLALECQPCYGGPLYGNCSHRSCLYSIEPSRVIAAIRDQMDNVATSAVAKAHAAGS
jgi:heptosyltransferase-2